MAAEKINKIFRDGDILHAEELNAILSQFNDNVDYINDLPTETLKGDNGSSPISCYKWFEKDATVNAPTSKVVVPEGWSKYAPDMPSDTSKTWYLWMSSNTLNGDGTITENWSTPVRISGEDGDNGADAKDREWIYKYSLDNYDGSTGQISPTGEANGTNTEKETKDDWVPNGWYDRALSVSESNPDVYASWRDYNTTTKKWGKFNPPINWSHWGSKGMDGDGVQYIYKLYPRELTSLELLSFIPSAPSSQNENKEWLPVSNSSSDMSTQDNPNTWTDDPETPTANYPFCYCSIIKQINGKWGTKNGDTFIEKKYGELSIWAKYSKDGIPGSSPINCYKWFAIGTTPSTPVNNENHPEEPDDPNDAQHPWSKYATARETNKHLWMSSNTKNGNGTVTESWSAPVRISGDNGDSGSDSKNREWIYNYINTFDNTKGGEVSPSGAAGDIISKNDGATLNDWVPYGWYDRALPVSDSLKDVYTSWRDKNPSDGTWGSFNEPFVWSHWGEDGNDGDGVLYVYKLFDHELSDNELESNIPTKPDSQTSGEWIPQGWSDNPVNPIKVLPYCYCSTIKEIDNVWGNFSKLALWSIYNNSTSPINCYKWYPKSTTTVTAPQNDELHPVIPDGWSRYAPNRPSSELHLWMSQNIIDNNGDLVDEWSAPIRITGEDGDAGSDTSRVREWIYNYHNRGYNGPDGEYSPHGEAGGDDSNDYTTDDFVPEGWYDTALAVSLQHPNVYASWRDFIEENEEWEDFNEPILWSHWGENGMDGDGVLYVFKIYPVELTQELRNNFKPIKPAQQNDNGEWLPVQNSKADTYDSKSWTDDAEATTPEFQYCYCSVIKRINNNWETSYGPLSLWSKYSIDGKSYQLVGNPTSLIYDPNTEEFIGTNKVTIKVLYNGKEVNVKQTISGSDSEDTIVGNFSVRGITKNGQSASLFINPGQEFTARSTYIKYEASLVIDSQVVAKITIPIILNGVNGELGSTGRMYYLAGEYNASIKYGTDPNICPIVHYSDKYWYLKGIEPVINEEPGLSEAWVEIDNFGVVLSDAIFTNFAKLGSFIIANDFFISQYGVLVLSKNGDTETTTTATTYNSRASYTYFDANDPMVSNNTTTPKFRPNKVINAKTGEEWMARGNVHLYGNNAEFKGTINAESGTIGGFIINGGILKSISETLELDGTSGRASLASGRVVADDDGTFYICTANNDNVLYLDATGSGYLGSTRVPNSSGGYTIKNGITWDTNGAITDFNCLGSYANISNIICQSFTNEAANFDLKRSNYTYEDGIKIGRIQLASSNGLKWYTLSTKADSNGDLILYIKDN